MTAQPSSEISQKLLALKSRLSQTPLMYRRADEFDLPDKQRCWYTTSFAHEQMMGNLQNCAELVDELIILLKDK